MRAQSRKLIGRSVALIAFCRRLRNMVAGGAGAIADRCRAAAPALARSSATPSSASPARSPPARSSAADGAARPTRLRDRERRPRLAPRRSTARRSPAAAPRRSRRPLGDARKRITEGEIGRGDPTLVYAAPGISARLAGVSMIEGSTALTVTPLALQLLGEALRQAMARRPDRGVGAQAGAGPGRRVSADADDRPAPLSRRRQRGLRGVDCRLQVDGEHCLPMLRLGPLLFA